ncbi:MAG: tetratricopeptide repeat protein [Fibromonadaceae bacterium]|nr:tetratricopeptide repeat protein [Fibromonadaceae bacterium]
MRVESYFFLILLAGVQAFAAENVLEYAYRAEYNKAFDEIAKIPKDDPSVCVLKGIVHFSRFDDLGDTLDLDSALLALRNCKTNEFWEPFRRFKIALVNDIKGNTIKSIGEARGAAQIFAKRADIDSKAFYAIYAYYSPFSKANLEDLKTGFEHSKMFSPILGTSFIWILYEEKKYAEALDITNTLLKRYPEHPVILQIKADMLFKLGKVEEAVAIYKQSEQIYAKRAPNSIRYWCAVANLAKMTKNDFWREKLQSKEYKRIKRWMPKDLR